MHPTVSALLLENLSKNNDDGYENISEKYKSVIEIISPLFRVIQHGKYVLTFQKVNWNEQYVGLERKLTIYR